MHASNTMGGVSFMSIVSRNTFETSETPVMNPHNPADTVKPYSVVTDFKYPYILMQADVIEKYKYPAFKGLLGTSSLVGNEGMYHIYLQEGEANPVKIGVVPDTTLRTLLTDGAFASYDKYIALNENEVYTGDICMALCPAATYA